MTYTSDRPLVVDGVRLDSLAWNIEKINRATAGRRSGDVEVPGRDGVIPSLNDSLEPSMMGLEMFIQGTDSDGTVPPEGKRDRFWANLDELVHLFGKRHALLEVIEQTGPGEYATNLATNPSMETAGPTVEVARNLAPNPRNTKPVPNTADYAVIADVAITGHPLGFTVGSSTSRTGTSEVTSVASLYGLDGLGATADVRHAGVWVKPSRNMSVTFYLDGDQASTTKTTIVPAETWAFVRPAKAASGNTILTAFPSDGGPVANTDYLQIAGAVSSVMPFDAYFDGGLAASGDYTYAWTGVAHNSASTKNAPSVSGASGEGTAILVRRTSWKASGSASLEIVSNGAVSASYAGMHGGSGALRLGMTPGKTYTASATFNTPTAQTNGDRNITVYTRVGSAGYVITSSPSAPAVGVGRVSLTFSVPTGATEAFVRLSNGSGVAGESVFVDDFSLVEGTAAPAYFDGSTPADATYNYTWTGTPDASASVRTPKARRRAWAKVTDSIQPDMNDSGGSGKFTVGLELPYGVWEDEATQDWTGTAGAASGTVQEVTTLQGATERITDAILLVLGPATNPRVTDPATGAYVELQAALAAGDRWRVNVGTWATRTGNIGLSDADTAGTDQQDVTRYGGTANQAAFLPLTPVRLDGTRKVRVALSGTGFTASTQMQVRARRKYAL